MPREMTATFNAQNAEADLPMRSDEIGLSYSRTPAHAAMVTRWMPVNRDRACVWYPAT